MSYFKSKFTRNKFTNVGNWESMEYVKLSDLLKQDGEGTQYPITGVFIMNGEFGEQAVVTTGKFKVNMPTHMTGIFKEMIKDDKAVEFINEGLAIFTIYTYKDKKGVERCSITLDDLWQPF